MHELGRKDEKGTGRGRRESARERKAQIVAGEETETVQLMTVGGRKPERQAPSQILSWRDSHSLCVTHP